MSAQIAIKDPKLFVNQTPAGALLFHDVDSAFSVFNFQKKISKIYNGKSQVYENEFNHDLSNTLKNTLTKTREMNFLLCL